MLVFSCLDLLSGRQDVVGVLADVVARWVVGGHDDKLARLFGPETDIIALLFNCVVLKDNKIHYFDLPMPNSLEPFQTTCEKWLEPMVLGSSPNVCLVTSAYQLSTGWDPLICSKPKRIPFCLGLTCTAKTDLGLGVGGPAAVKVFSVITLGTMLKLVLLGQFLGPFLGKLAELKKMQDLYLFVLMIVCAFATFLLSLRGLTLCFFRYSL